jgi:CheY-like chemotaxis protein
MHLLLVEDHFDTAEAFSRLLTRFGYTVQVACDVQTALGLCKTNTFDVLLVDIKLPDGTGWDLMKNLLARRPVRGIAVSGCGYGSDIKESLEAGFAEHLTKPVGADQLIRAIERVAALPPAEPVF